MIIDVHAHYYAPKYFESLGKAIPMPAPYAPLMGFSMAERLALMDSVGINRQIISSGQTQPYLSNQENACRSAALANDEFRQICEEYPERFSYFAVLPLPHVKACIEEIDRVREIPSVVGFTIGSTVAGLHLDDSLLDDVFAKLNQVAGIVFVHPVGKAFEQNDDPYNLAWLIGSPFEDTNAVVRLILSGIVDRYPSIRFIVPHLGGTLPFLLARIERMQQKDLGEKLQNIYFDTVSGSFAALECSCKVLGSSRLLFGSDYPRSNEKEFASRLSYLRELECSSEELEDICGRRASDLLFGSAGMNR